jgi:hypothetical protein
LDEQTFRESKIALLSSTAGPFCKRDLHQVDLEGLTTKGPEVVRVGLGDLMVVVVAQAKAVVQVAGEDGVAAERRIKRGETKNSDSTTQ